MCLFGFCSLIVECVDFPKSARRPSAPTRILLFSPVARPRAVLEIFPFLGYYGGKSLWYLFFALISFSPTPSLSIGFILSIILIVCAIVFGIMHFVYKGERTVLCGGGTSA